MENGNKILSQTFLGIQPDSLGKTLNWKLEFHHDGEFTFGKDLIYDGHLELQNNKKKLEKALKEMEEQKKETHSTEIDDKDKNGNS